MLHPTARPRSGFQADLLTDELLLVDNATNGWAGMELLIHGLEETGPSHLQGRAHHCGSCFSARHKDFSS